VEALYISSAEGDTMKLLRTFTISGFLLVALPLLGQTKSAPQQSRQQPQSKPASTVPPDRGQQVFAQNCSRCHNSPEGFAPQISGAIAMHMRVRAGLSDEDYKALRRFLNP
jgi:cytochrome c5